MCQYGPQSKAHPGDALTRKTPRGADAVAFLERIHKMMRTELACMICGKFRRFLSGADPFGKNRLVRHKIRRPICGRDLHRRPFSGSGPDMVRSLEGYCRTGRDSPGPCVRVCGKDRFLRTR